jgi:hypothetical protein
MNSNDMSQIYEIKGALYTPNGKHMVMVSVNGIDGCISFFDPCEQERADSRFNFDFVQLKRGWVFTDFLCKHRNKPITYKLTFLNAIGDDIKAVLDAAGA